jgi:hypothetical protein
MLLYICQLYAFVYVLQTPSIVFYIWLQIIKYGLKNN